MLSSLILNLNSTDAHDAALAGAKGASLARLISAGHPVPRGFVITTRAFQSVVESLSPRRNRRTALLSAPLPEELTAAILKAHRSLQGRAVSVRSSSNAEDLADASFAGQYESFLNVRTRKSLLESVRTVWASLYSDHAVDYRRRNGISETDVRMAVVVQQQLDSHAAGVLFTRDPVSGDNRFVVSAAFGQGEGVVSGSAHADRYVLIPRTGRRAGSDIATKESKIVPSSGGGTKTIPVARRLRNKPALTDPHLKVLAKHAREIVRLLKGPQDIEFAAVGRKIYILQARPMTAIEEVEPDTPWDLGLDKRYTWRLRGHPTPRLQEECGIIRRKHAANCFRQTGAYMTRDHVAHQANGYTWLRPDVVSRKELKARQSRQRKRCDRSLRKGKSYYEDVLRGIIEEDLKKIQMKRRKAKDFAGLVAYLEAAMDFCGYVQGHLHWAQIRPGGPPEIRYVYHELTGRPESEASVFTQAIQNRMTRLILRLRELARIAQNDPELKRLFLKRRWQDLESQKIRRRSATKRFQKRFQQMLSVYGLRAGHGYGASTGFLTPTWNMDPTQSMEVIASYVEQDLDRLDELDRQARAERIRMTARMRRQLANEPRKLVRFEESLFEETLRARSLEDHNHMMEGAAMGTLREAINDVGTHMLALDLIDKADSVRYFGIRDLKRLARMRECPDQRPFVRARVAELERQHRMKAPELLGRKPRPPKKGKKPTTRKQDDRGRSGNLLKGRSACRGRATGEAVVIRPGKPRPRLRPGDILVASNVGPDWTPSFGIIAALVLDHGSLWQHAGVMAREYRVPTVMETREATKHIVDGQTITVDGDKGAVELGSD